jgi:hypothetical protein
MNGEIWIAEVYFFIHLSRESGDIALALVSLYSRPDPALLRVSVNTLWSCEYQGDSSLKFIDVKCIQSVVAMIPHKPVIEGREARERYFLVEKPGLDVAMMAGTEEAMTGDGNGIENIHIHVDTV